MATMLLAAARSLTFAAPSSARAMGCAAPSLWSRLSSTRGFSDDSHDDFKPKFNPATADVASTIEHDIRNNKVLVYMKGVPEAPMCGFSNTVVRILDAYGVDFASRNVLADPDLREGIKKFTQWPTIPQVFVDGEFIGGCDIVMGMHESGDLSKIFMRAKAGE